LRTMLCVLLGWVMAVSTLQAGNYSFEGTFLTDDQVQLFDFTLTSAGTVTLQSYGYGGGTNAAGTAILAGGFDSLFSWFGSDGSLIDVNDDGCGLAGSNHGACLDAFATPLLSAGTYTLALTESGNDSLGVGFPGDLSLGFSEQGQGDFTASGSCPAFCDVFGNQDNGNWAVDILNVSSASEAGATPEPATILLAGCGIALMGLAKRLRATNMGERS
jgi:hypothetical protein